MKRFNMADFVSNEETPVMTQTGENVIVMQPFITGSYKPVAYLHEGSSEVHRASDAGIDGLETELYFKTPQDDLPKTWEEALYKYEYEGIYYIDNDSVIMPCRLVINDKESIGDFSNTIVSKEEANAFLSLMKLRLIRKTWVGDFDAISDKLESKYGIRFFANAFRVEYSVLVRDMLSFPTKEMAEQFLETFNDILDETKPLYK